MDAQSPHATRLRLHPDMRALGDSQIIDLASALRQLRDEDHAATHGHRQITLFQQGSVTMILISFASEGVLPGHSVDGVVMIQAIEGALTIRVDGIDHRLERSQVLVLKPGLVHDVRAAMPSAVLLTIHTNAARRE